MRCYLFVAILGVIGWWRKSLVAVAMVFLYAKLLNNLRFPDWQQPSFDRFMLYFVAGSLVYTCKDKLRISWISTTIAASALLLGCLPGWDRWLELALPTAGVYLLFALAYSRTIRFHQFGRNADLSYGIYLYAFPIQQAEVALLGIRSPILLFLLAVPPTLLLAWVSWNWVEKPALSRKRASRDASPLTVPDVVNPRLKIENRPVLAEKDTPWIDQGRLI